MAIQNIQALQYNINDLTSKSDEYLLQSLANLGQRTGIKGDSIITNSFIISSLLAKYYTFDKTTKDNYCGCLTYSQQDGLYVKIVEKSDLTSVVEGCSRKLEDIFTDYTTNADIELPAHINENVEHYNAGGKILYNPANQQLTTMFIGNDGEHDVEFACIEFDYNKNVLLSEILLTVTYANDNDQNSDSYYSLYYTYKDDSNDSLYHYNIYSCNVNYDDNITSFIFDTIRNILKTSSSITIDYLISSLSYPIGENIINIFNIKVDKNNKYDISYNNEYKNFYVDSLNAAVYIPERLTNDLVYFYPYIVDYRNNLAFKQNNEQIYIYIIYNIVSTLCKEYIEQEQITTSDKINIYYPVDYSLEYYCNSNDNTLIYALTTNIPCHYYKDMPTSITDDLDMLTIPVNNAYSKIRLYNFTVLYNNEKPDVIIGIQTTRIYTLPYINESGYWVVNDNTTRIKAKGEDAGNPNVILAITDRNNLYPISLGNIVENLNGYNLIPIETTIYIDTPRKFINNQNSSDSGVTLTNTTNEAAKPCIVKCLLPEIKNEEQYNIFKYSLFINLYKVTGNVDEDVKLKEVFGVGGYATTFWTLKREKIEDTNLYKYEWACLVTGQIEIIDDDKTVIKPLSLTPADILGLPGLFDYYFNHSNFINSNALIFDYIHFSEVGRPLKNVTDQNGAQEQTRYPIFRNLNKSNYKILYENLLVNPKDYTNDSILHFALYDNRGAIDPEEQTGMYTFAPNTTKYLDSKIIDNKLQLLPIFNKHNDGIFNDVPGVDFQETFLYNANFVNRLNILMPTNDNTNTIYNAFIGIDNIDRSVIHFGATEINNNIGAATLYTHTTNTNIDSNINTDISIFEKQNKLNIDFVTTTFEDTTVSHVNWQKQTIVHNNIRFDIYNTIWNPIGTATFMNLLGFSDNTLLGEVTVKVKDIINEGNTLYYINDTGFVVSTNPPEPSPEPSQDITTTTTTTTLPPIISPVPVKTYFINITYLLRSLNITNIISKDLTTIEILTTKNESIFSSNDIPKNILMLTTAFDVSSIYGWGIYTSNPLSISVIKKYENGSESKVYVTIDEISLGERLDYSSKYI